jgi:hypothetical protein
MPTTVNHNTGILICPFSFFDLRSSILLFP